MAEGRLSLGRAAQLIKLSRRQVYRIVARFQAEGDRAVVHRARGRPPNNAKGLELRAKVPETAKADVFRGFGPGLDVPYHAPPLVWKVVEGLSHSASP